MKRMLCAVLCTLLAAGFLSAESLPTDRLIWYTPADAADTDEITLYYNAALGNGVLKDFTGDLYAHTGVITNSSTGDSDWKHAPDWNNPTDKYKLTRTSENANIYYLKMVPRTFYGLTTTESIKKFAFLAGDYSRSKIGRAANGGDIMLEFTGGGGGGEFNGSGVLGKFQTYELTDNGCTVTAENGKLFLTAYNSGVVKVFTVPTGLTIPERRSITVSASPKGSFSLNDETAEALILTTGDLSVRIEKNGCRIDFINADGTTSLSERDGINNGSTRSVTFRGMNDRAFYGAGYNGCRVNLNDCYLTMDNLQTGNWEAEWGSPTNHNINIPFVVSSNGYGILFDDHYRGATMHPSSSGTTYQTGSLSPISYYYIGSSDKTMAGVLENYTFLTGRQELPPYWSLGYITSRYGYHSATEASNVIRDIKACGIPLDGLVFDLYWQGADESGMGNLDWYSPNFPDPRGMLADFRSKGVHTIPITEPFFTSSTTNYSPMLQRGYFADADVSRMEWLRSSRVGLLDATNPEALDYMWEFYKARTEEGVDGWWLDLGEPESHDADSQHMGGSVEEVHNEFGQLWLERVYRGLKEDFPNLRPFLMPRSGTSGMQRLSAFPWTGDIRRSWGGLQAQIPSLLSSGMAGVAYMGSDVGGFISTGVNPALYRRWVQMAVFSPMLRTHSSDSPEPYLSYYDNVREDVKNAINLRYSFIPYSYTLCYENALKGTPMARPLNFHDSADLTASEIPTDQYLWGRDLLVAPVVTDATSRRISFPQGSWVDMNDPSKVYEGGTSVTYDAPTSLIPYFGRKGSFITRFAETEYSNTASIDRSRLKVTYLIDEESSDSFSGYIYEDDGTSTDALEEGNHMITRFTADHVNGGINITISHEGSYPGMPESREISFEIPGYTQQVMEMADTDGNVFTPASEQRNSMAKAPAAHTYSHDGYTLRINTTVPTSGTRMMAMRSTATGIASLAEAVTVFEYSPSSHLFTYSLPEGVEASISIYDMTGLQAAILTDLTADGSIHQISCDTLSPGAYVARLNVAGSSTQRTVKMIVK